MTATLDRPAASPPPVNVPPQTGGAMRKVSMRGLMAHKMRFILTLLAVTLGTAFVTGSFILTNALGNSINAIVGGSLKNTDVIVMPADGSSTTPPLSLVDKLHSVDGVYGVEPVIGTQIAMLDSSGHAIQTGGAPTQGGVWSEGKDNATSPLKLVDGRAPAATDEVAVNLGGLERGNLKVGDTTKVLLPKRGLVPVKVVGSYDTDFAVGGYIGVLFTKEQAIKEFTDGKTVDMIAVSSAPDSSVSQETLRDRISQVLPSGLQAQTGQKILDDSAKQVQAVTGFLTTFLLIFGIIGLAVGASLIYITFAMVIAQRMRELALLRAIGASRGQILRSVLGEGLVVGLVGSAIGIALGYLLGWGLLQLMSSSFGIPMGNATLTPTTLLTALGLGVGVTVLSAIAPAARAGSIAPIEAMRGQFATPKAGRVRFAIGVLILLAGIGLTAWGVSAGELLGIGLGFVVVLISLVLLSVYLAPAFFVLARPITNRTPVGRLAHGNTIRNPKRTASTAFALAIGLALVSGLSLIGASAKESLTGAITKEQAWDYGVVTSQRQALLTPRVMDQIAQAPGVAGVVMIGYAQVQVGAGDENKLYANSTTGDVGQMLTPEMAAGKLQVDANHFVANKSTASAHNWTVGQPVSFTLANGTTRSVTLAGIVNDGGTLDPLTVDHTLGDLYTPPQYRYGAMALTKASPGTSEADLKASLDKVMADFPLATVMSKSDYINAQTSFVTVFLGILYGLLGLALVISILGIVNTLALSVVERTREVGMMRAIGAQRAQIRRMVTSEAVMICLYGAIIGLVLGLTYGWLIVGSLSDDGLTERVIPWTQTGLSLVAAIIVALLAAIWPAMKAARTRPLDAIAED